jgi:hypothetical protein
MAKAEPSFDAPIPGMSLTAEVGSRPWQNPPKYAAIDDVLNHYIPRITSPARAEELLDIMELGVPVTSLADTIQMAGVMQGLHTVDVGVLAIPVIMETLAYMADKEGIEYELGMQPTEDEDNIPETKIALAMKKLKEKMPEDATKSEEIDVEKPVVKNEPVVDEDVPTSLMARRV